MVTPKGEASRTFLLRTSAAVFARHGYGATTMAQLIAAGGLTKGAFYFHFASKADLAQAVLADQQERWLAAVDERLEAVPSAKGKLLALIPALLQVMRDDPSTWAVTALAHELVTDPALTAAVRAKQQLWVDRIADLVRAGQAAGEVRDDLDAGHTAAALVAAFDGLKVLTDVLDDEGDRADLLERRAVVLIALLDDGLFA